MGLIFPQEIEIIISNGNNKYYESLGYIIPKKYDKKHKKYVARLGEIIKVNVKDIRPNSCICIKTKCDVCGVIDEIPMIDYTRTNKQIKQHKKEYDYLCMDCKFEILPNAKLYVGLYRNNNEKIKNFLLKKLKTFVEHNGYPVNKKRDFRPQNNMPTLKLYEEHLDGDLVDWLSECGYILSDNEIYNIRSRGGKDKNISKEDCIKIIIDMQNKLKRPLKYDDFRNPSPDEVGITLINKYWGSVNKMKKELGLVINKDSMIDKQMNQSDFDNEILSIVNYLKDNNRNFTTTREVNNNKNWHRYDTLNKACKQFYGIKLIDYLKRYGIYLGNQGFGVNYDFEDGEHISSYYEYLFSKHLKDIGLKFNVDYKRDVPYSSFINNYKGRMNCDYVIFLKHFTLYIEIAGIISDYKMWYYNNRPIEKSKTKEQYRLKLFKKESMLKDNDLKYYILFPCDLTTKNMNEIVRIYDIKFKKNIESFYKNNIDWNKVKEIGELDYADNIIRDTSHKKT